jgi:hypothetical protein
MLYKEYVSDKSSDMLININNKVSVEFHKLSCKVVNLLAYRIVPVMWPND